MRKKVRFGLLIIGDEILSSKRQDRHLKNLNNLLQPRGLELGWVRIISDEPEFLVQTLKETFASGDVVFSCGGIGATPDDRTRQSAADALGVPLERHPEAVPKIEAQFGEGTYPNRIKMVEFPKGAAIIPNEFNRVPGFSVQEHYFMPGFPQMSEMMMEWVLETYYKDLFQEPRVEKAIRLINGSESEWLDYMVAFEQRFPNLRLFSLPHIKADDRRFIELGVAGIEREVDLGLQDIIKEADLRGQVWEPQN